MEVTQMPPSCWRCPEAVMLVMGVIETRRIADKASAAVTEEYGPVHYAEMLKHAEDFKAYAAKHANDVELILSWRAIIAERRGCPGVTDLLECPLGSE